MVETDTLSIHLLDKSTGKPLGNRKYVVKFKDGTIRAGKLDQDGNAKEERIPNSEYEITFEDIDENSEQKKK